VSGAMSLAVGSAGKLRPRRGRFAVALVALAFAGCVELLPKEIEEVASPRKDFGEAKAATEKIVPYATTKADLQASGIAPHASPDISLLTCSESILRFPLGGAVPQGKLDRGLRERLNAGKACYGYAITARQPNSPGP
jgi:hypothetical protein